MAQSFTLTGWSPPRPRKVSLAGRGRSPRLGQITELLTGGIAKQVADAVEPALRRVINEERTRLADALISGVPFATLSALAWIGTTYLIPDKPLAKTVGYTTSVALFAVGAWWVYDNLREAEAAAAAPPSPSGAGVLEPAAKTAAKAFADEAVPRIHALVSEERQRIAAALQSAVPFAAAALAAFLATLFLVKPEDKTWKALGYSGTAALLGAGAWIALEKEKVAA